MNWLMLMRWLSSAWMSAINAPTAIPATRPTIGEPDSDATYAAVKAPPSIIPSTEMLSVPTAFGEQLAERDEEEQHREASGALQHERDVVHVAELVGTVVMCGPCSTRLLDVAREPA